MERFFQDRTDAGRQLADRLGAYAGRGDVIVLALPRGGVPVAYQVATRLCVPLDVFIVRKLGVPGYEELALGAIASGGVRVLNQDVMRVLPDPETIVEQVTAAELIEMERRERAYRDGRPAPDVHGRIAILIDDGLATGATMHAAVEALRERQPAKIVVAVPVCAPETGREIQQIADEIVYLSAPDWFQGVGQFYNDFSQTTDDEVCRLLALASSERNRGDSSNCSGGL
jgi:putative phosphoribosyl transferase